MANEDLLPEELEKAARTLEERFMMLRIPARKIAAEEWNSVPADIRRHIPPWIEVLLSQFALAGAVLEYRDHKNPYVRQFSLYKPDEFTQGLKDAEIGCLGILPKYGFIPIAYEQDGSMWVTRIAAGPSGEIYMLDHSGWDGGEPTKQNGLVFAGSRLSLLLASMGVSEGSYYESPAGITSVIWHKEK
jgi:hypothetical protein